MAPEYGSAAKHRKRVGLSMSTAGVEWQNVPAAGGAATLAPVGFHRMNSSGSLSAGDDFESTTDRSCMSSPAIRSCLRTPGSPATARLAVSFSASASVTELPVSPQWLIDHDEHPPFPRSLRGPTIPAFVPVSNAAAAVGPMRDPYEEAERMMGLRAGHDDADDSDSDSMSSAPDEEDGGGGGGGVEVVKPTTAATLWSPTHTPPPPAFFRAAVVSAEASPKVPFHADPIPAAAVNDDDDDDSLPSDAPPPSPLPEGLLRAVETIKRSQREEKERKREGKGLRCRSPRGVAVPQRRESDPPGAVVRKGVGVPAKAAGGIVERLSGRSPVPPLRGVVRPRSAASPSPPPRVPLTRFASSSPRGAARAGVGASSGKRSPPRATAIAATASAGVSSSKRSPPNRTKSPVRAAAASAGVASPTRRTRSPGRGSPPPVSSSSSRLRAKPVAMMLPR